MDTRTVEIALVAAAFAGPGISWMWPQLRKFDKGCGHTGERPPGE